MRKYIVVHIVFVISLLLTTYFLLLTASSVLAQENEKSLDDINKQIQEYEQKLKDLAGQKQTLGNAIVYLNTQIALTQTRITQTEQTLAALGHDIDDLVARIDRLNTSLDTLSTILIERVRESYKQDRVEPLYLFFASTGFTDFVNQVKYIRAAQIHDRELLLSMERTRSNYDIQKQELIRKQDEVEALNTTLKKQKSSLATQQQEKQRLLEVTKNDEKKYQQLLAEARAQLAAFRRFVAGQGGATLLKNQTKCDSWGCYYNQRDDAWGSMALGISEGSVAEYGCLVTSVSMIASHYGKDVKPSHIASESTAFFSNTAYLLHNFTVNGINVKLTWVSMSTSTIDSELQAGHPVIAGLYSGPDHFIVIKGKDDKGYIMNDPFLENGNDRPLSDKYQVTDISSLRLVSF